MASSFQLMYLIQHYEASVYNGRKFKHFQTKVRKSGTFNKKINSILNILLSKFLDKDNGQIWTSLDLLNVRIEQVLTVVLKVHLQTKNLLHLHHNNLVSNN